MATRRCLICDDPSHTTDYCPNGDGIDYSDECDASNDVEEFDGADG